MGTGASASADVQQQLEQASPEDVRAVVAKLAEVDRAKVAEALAKAGAAGGDGTPPYFPVAGTSAEREALSPIMPHAVYLTNWHGAENADECKRIGVTHIVSAGEEFAGCSPLKETLGIEYHILDVVDDEAQAAKMQSVLDKAVDFMRRALDGKGIVLVHCAAGISRSTTVVLAFLMREKALSLREAFDVAYSARRVIWPNTGFMRLLAEYEVQLQRADPARRGGAAGQQPFSSIAMEEYQRWSEYDPDSYSAAKVLDRDGNEITDPFLKLMAGGGDDGDEDE